MNLNERGLRVCRQIIEYQTELGVAVECDESGAHIIDCGVDAVGGIEAGRYMAEACLAGLGRVNVVSSRDSIWPGPTVSVVTDHPVAACMASQYAGWPIGGKDFFAMGSGPMRAVRGREELFEKVGFREEASHVVGCLESDRVPNAGICNHVAEDCHVEPQKVTLLVAPTSSLAGSIQVVARTVETALHKMCELGMDLSQVISGCGHAPLPPIAKQSLQAIGWTNDAVLYGGEVTIWLRGDDDNLAEMGPQIPSKSSSDFGKTFAELYRAAGNDFYKMDPKLFSPAVVNLMNLNSGRTFRFGELRGDVLQKSFSAE